MKLTAKQLATAFVAVAEGKSGKQLDAVAQEFIQLLAQRQELYRIREVVRAVDAVWREKYGAANITITTAYPMEKGLRQAIEKAAMGASIKEIVEPSLIGGARIRLDDRMIDGSVAGRLESIRTTLGE